MVSHEPYRDWCPTCVAGRGRSHPHVRRADTSEDALTVIGIDYGYMAPEGVDENDADAERRVTPILCGRDRKHRWTFAMAVPCKGTGHPWPTKALARELGLAGHRRYAFMSEGEPSIVDFKRASQGSLATGREQNVCRRLRAKETRRATAWQSWP